MNKDKDGAVKDADGKLQNKRSTRAKKYTKEHKSVRLPILLELTYTLSTLILILLGLTIMITSIISGAGVFTAILRTAVAVTVMGCLLMLISSQISSGLLFSVKVEQEEEQRKQEESVVPMSNESLDQAEA